MCVSHSSLDDLALQFKTHVLCHLEFNTGRFYHACDTILAGLDRVQSSFIRDVGLTPVRAFLDFNLAPLQLRRDIAMLGVIFGATHGTSQESMCSLFVRQRRRVHASIGTRLSQARHTLQLMEPTCTHSPVLFKRSIFGLVRIWNLLPQHIVTCDNVSTFQRHLTSIARFHCRADTSSCASIFSPRRHLPLATFTDFVI